MSANKTLKAPPLKPLCSYPGRLCTRDRLRGYSYCINHILRDKEAPFQRCSFALNGKQCRNAAPKGKRGIRYCPYHVHRFNLLQSMSVNNKAAENNDASPTRNNDNGLQNSDSSSKFSPSTAYKQISKKYGFEDHDLKMKDMWLESSDESESDLESDAEDPLKYAGVYTYEEIASIYKTKLMRLQSLYIDQCKYLYHCLKEKRRKYLHAKEAEKNYNLTSSFQKLNPEEQVQYELLKSMFRYRRHYGREAILFRKYMKKRTEQGGENIPHTKNFTQCSFSENNQRCVKEAVVLTKYCFDHILQDPNQVMFKKCEGAANCPKPVIPIADVATCILHSQCRGPPEKKSTNNTVKNIVPSASATSVQNEKNPEPLQSIDDLASLELNAVSPQSLFNLNQYGDVDESFGDSIINLVSGYFDSKDSP